MDNAGAAGGDGERGLAFEHRNHGFEFEIRLETRGFGGAFAAILASLIEEIVDFVDLLFVDSPGLGEAAAGSAGDHFQHGGIESAASGGAAECREDEVH